jgi:hypothetical protein
MFASHQNHKPMKTLRFLFVALLIAGTANAQFFQRVYGSQRNDILESGMNYDNPALGQGYVMCGYTDYNSTAVTSPMVTRTFLNGNVNFNNTYLLNFFGRFVDASARRVITYPNGQIGVIGDFSYQPGAQHTEIFYMLLNPNGPVAGAFVWTYAFPNVRSIEATSITPSVAPAPQQNMYACGNITDFNGGRHPFIMCVQAFTGAPVWGFDYADVGIGAYEWTLEDLIESPYLNTTTGMVDVALVGRHVGNAGAFGDGILLTVDAATGAPSGVGGGAQPYIYGTPNSEDNFNAITIANNPFPNGVRGYAIAGSTTNYAVPVPNSDMWALKVQPNGIVQFTTQMDYSLGNRNDYGYDIVERVSPTLGFQYFVGGYVDQGVFGQEDEVVYKLDVTGSAYFGPGGLNQFTYGGPGFERILQLDFYQNGVGANNIGLSAFNWTTGSFPAIGQFDFYHVKSYFNGVTPVGAVGGGVGNCQHDQQDMHWMDGPPLLDSTKCIVVFKPKRDSLRWDIIPMQDRIICLRNAAAGGDNVRLANPGDFGLSGTTLFPNPVSRTNPLVNLTFEVPGYGDEVDLDLYNSLGQVVMHKRETLGDGQMLLQVNLGDGLSAGVYSLVVRREGKLITHKISVE